MSDDDEDTRMGYDARSFHELVQFQRGGPVTFATKRMSDGAVKLNRLQFGFRLLIGEEHPFYV